MTSDEKIVKSYFNWMCDLVCNTEQKRNYSELLYFLASVEFTYSVFMDKNRLQDGLTLRYRFAYDMNMDNDEVHHVLDEPCSVLEMMVALALKCEETLMTSTEYDNRTGVWFWGMIDSLGLNDMTNAFFDIDECELIISRFLDRDYDRTGAGGLFTVKGREQDMRDVEIWMQMNWYISQTMR